MHEARSIAFVYRSLALPLGLLSLSRHRHQQLGMLLSANRLVCVRYLVSYSLDYLAACSCLPISTLCLIHPLPPAHSCGSRDLSLGRDSLFKVLVFWLFLCHKISVSKWRRTFVGRGRHYCFVHVSLLCVDCWIIEWWPCTEWPVISWSLLLDHHFHGYTSLYYVSNDFFSTNQL